MTPTPASDIAPLAPDPIRIYGWYDRADQPCGQPSHDPGMDVACPHCGHALDPRDVRTYSMAKPGAARSYFYRTHRSCAVRADERETEGVFCAVLDRIRHNKD